jgi:hypothetical protein
MVLLVTILWIAFVQEKTPLNLLRWRFWIEADAWVMLPSETASEAQKAENVEEKIEDVIGDETTDTNREVPIATGSSTTWSTTSWTATAQTSTATQGGGSLSEADKKAARDLIDALIIE